MHIKPLHKLHPTKRFYAVMEITLSIAVEPGGTARGVQGQEVGVEFFAKGGADIDDVFPGTIDMALSGGRLMFIQSDIKDLAVFSVQHQFFDGGVI